MEDESLASLKTGIMARAVRVRALRRWNPRFHTNITSYVFVDRFGAGIQAIAWGSKDQKHVESLIEVGNCYEIDRYACAKPVKYINALSHETNMRIGFTTSITPLEDLPEIPHHYFNFGTYQKLRDICDNEDEITDYYGKLQGIIEDKSKRDGSPFVTFNIIDISDEPIQVTLWNEIATAKNRFDRESIEKATGPVIIAVTSMKVSSYSRRPALQSTSNTFVFLNPQTPETEHFLNRLHHDDFQGIRQEQQTTTISEILGKRPSDLQGTTFLCKAKVQKITSTIEWYRSVCPTCSHEVFKYGENWLCPTDGEFERPIYMYQLSAILEDNTGEIHANINESPATAIIGIDCPQLRIDSACRPDYAIPTEIRSIKGRSMTFHIQAYREARSGKLKAVVHNVTNMEIATKPTSTPATPETRKISSTASKRLDFESEGVTTGNSKRSKKSQ